MSEKNDKIRSARKKTLEYFTVTREQSKRILELEKEVAELKSNLNDGINSHTNLLDKYNALIQQRNQDRYYILTNLRRRYLRLKYFVRARASRIFSEIELKVIEEIKGTPIAKVGTPHEASVYDIHDMNRLVEILVASETMSKLDTEINDAILKQKESEITPEEWNRQAMPQY